MWGMPPPGVKANFTLLQLTALLFGLPAILAYVIGYDIGACVYGMTRKIFGALPVVADTLIPCRCQCRCFVRGASPKSPAEG